MFFYFNASITTNVVIELEFGCFKTSIVLLCLIHDNTGLQNYNFPRFTVLMKHGENHRLSQVTDKLDHTLLYRVHLIRVGNPTTMRSRPR
jgi:hypothetical protein